MKTLDVMKGLGLHRSMVGKGAAMGRWACVVAWLAGLAYAADPGVYPRAEREAARAWFLRWWPHGQQYETGFTGDIAAVRPGATSLAWQEYMLTRANLFRRMAGLQPVSIKPEYTPLCQAGATLLGAKGEFSHNPPQDWPGWSPDAAAGCQQSNIGTGFATVCPILDLMNDFGVYSVGHREYILTPGLRYTAFGAAPHVRFPSPQGYAFLMHVGDPSFVNPDPDYGEPFVLWPSAGWFPNALLVSHWSVSPADFSTRSGSHFDLSQAQVTVTRNGVKLPASGRSTGGGRFLFTLDGDPAGQGNLAGVVDGVQTPAFNYLPAVGGDLGYGEVRAYGLNADREDPFADVIYEVALSGIRELDTGELWRGHGEYRYTVRVFDHQAGPPVPGQARLVNISARAAIGKGDQRLIGGFALRSSAPRRLLVRGVGPGLVPFKVSGVLADPELRLLRHLGGAEWAEEGLNGDWAGGGQGLALVAAAQATGAFALAEGSRDAALLATLAPQNYTAVVGGVNDTLGTGLVEVYDADVGTQSDEALVNISARAFVGEKDNAYLIAGFVLQGDLPRTVLIRATGQDLTRFGVTQPLLYPHLELYDGQNEVTYREIYLTNPSSLSTRALEYRANLATARVGGYPSVEGNQAAVLLLTLEPGKPYTAIVRAGGPQVSRGEAFGPQYGSGQALIEVYAY